MGAVKALLRIADSQANGWGTGEERLIVTRHSDSGSLPPSFPHAGRYTYG